MDNSTQVKDYTSQFLATLGLSPLPNIQVTHSQEDNSYSIHLDTPNPSLIIGFHGETITAIQFVLAQHLHSLFGDWVNISLNVNDYNERRERSLYDLADSTVSQVLATHRPYALPPLSASERRLIHMYLSEHPQVPTMSEGEGRARTLIISPKV